MSATPTLSQPGSGHPALRWVLVCLLGFLAPAAALAQTSVTTLGGGPNQSNQSSASGNADGNTQQFAQFNTPGGMILDISGRYLYLADTANGSIRRLDLTGGNTTTYLSGLSSPVDVAIDSNTNLYVLTQGDGLIRQYDQFGQLIATNNATVLATPTALAFDGSANLYVTELGGAALTGLLKRVALSNGAVTTIVGAGTFTSPRGVEVLDGGAIAVSDTGNHVIRLVNPTSLAVTLLSGLSGTSGTNVGTAAQSRFSAPYHLAKSGGDVLVVADQGNHRLRVVTTNGSTSVLYGIPSNSWVTVSAPGVFPGWFDSTAEFAEAHTPAGVVVDGSGNVFVTEQFYHLVRRASGSGLTGASGVGTGGSSTSISPPSLAFSPSSGYFPLGTVITVSSSSTNVFFTTDGSAPSTNSTRVLMSSGTGSIQWNNSLSDLTSLRVAAFLFSGTNSASTNVTGTAVTATTIGVPAGVNTSIFAGAGSRVVVPIVLNLRTNDTLRSLQFRVEVTPNGAAPIIGANFGALSISSNDFVVLTTGGSAATFTSLPYTAGLTTRGLSISFLGTNSGLLVNQFAVVALVAIPIPGTVAPGNTYNIDVLLPSGTSDGAQSSVSIASAGTRTLVVTNLTYRVGDTSPGGWYNAGDFGNGNLDNADVNNAFAAAAGIKLPFAFSDAFDAMDAFPEDTAGTVGGDGQIRFLDWQIILVRALRLNTNPSLGVSTTNWSRSWSAGVRTTGMTNLVPAALRPASVTPPGEVWHRPAAIGALPVENAQPGTAVNVPIYTRVAPGALLAGLQFRAVVNPLADAPPLTQPPQFIPASVPLTPTITTGSANAVAAGWNVGQFALAAQTSTVLGHVRFTVPANATAGAGYAVRFANADGAPDLFTQYNFETRGAVVWVQRTAPAPTSAISDEWRMAFFGATPGAEAADLADPDGDGVSNVLEYFAGTDPTKITSRVQLNPAGWRNSGRDLAFQLLSAPGKLYVLESNADLLNPVWSPVITTPGDGNLKEFIQAVTPGGPRYFRLRVLP